jgi:DedD protein
MDPALKQRLIGAAVLVALAVIFLPMLIGGPEPTATRRSDVSLDMPPAPDRPMQTREIPLMLPVPEATTPASPRPVNPDAIVTIDADVAPRVDARPEDELPVATAPPPEAAPSVAAATPAASVAAPPTPAPRADAATAVSGTRFVVNLGSYGNAANAEALRVRLRDAGLKVYGEPIQIDGKPATRLRAGPYASRAEAEAARTEARRQQADVPAAVVILDSDAPGGAPARPAVASGFAVQVGALKSESEANTLAGRLRTAGFSAYVERAQTDSGTLWRVRAGPELQRDRAERLREEIRAKLRLDGLVVSHP